MDEIVEWRKQEVNTSKRVIWTWSMCNYKGRGLVVGRAQGNIPSARAKNSENQREYDDLRYIIERWGGQQVNALWTNI
jgi:hypothetical protein